MSLLLWTFWTYSFFGYLLERGYAAATRAAQPPGKGFLLLPLCPVYGLGALAVLALPPALTDGFWSLALWGGLTATAVEYGVHLLYDRLLGVRFWDYSRLPGNFLYVYLLPGLPALLPGLGAADGGGAAAGPACAGAVLAAIPPAVTYAVLLVFTADAVVSLRLLRRAGDPGILSLRALGRA